MLIRKKDTGSGGSAMMRRVDAAFSLWAPRVALCARVWTLIMLCALVLLLVSTPLANIINSASFYVSVYLPELCRYCANGFILGLVCGGLRRVPGRGRR
jgi:hypothetical protein